MYKTLSGILMILVICGAFVLQASAQTDKQIAEIKRIYGETNEKIKECDESGEYSSTFLSELVVNKNNGSYPAVGIFRSAYKFYYTYGDREKNPYPNRLLKVVIETKRSANTEKSEFLFNEKEQLIFYFESKTEGETAVEKRVYFRNEAAFKFLVGDKAQDLRNAETIKFAKTILAEKKKLAAIFQNSLDY